MIRYLRLFLLFLTLCMSAMLHAQLTMQVTDGPLQKKQLHERFLRLVKGGDGYFYAFKGSLGHYWSFGAEGEYGVQIFRLDPQTLAPVDTLKIKRFARDGQPRNILEVIPAPNGIAFLTVAQDQSSHLPNLLLCRPDFSSEKPRYSIEKLLDLPNLKIGIDRPCVRITFNRDSSAILVTLRRLGSDENNDRSLTCMMLDRELHVISGGPQMPFKQFWDDILVREILVIDSRHVIITAQTSQPANGLGGPGTIGYGIMHWDMTDQELRLIKFAHGLEVPVDTRLSLGPQGEILAAGWYLDQNQERREAGIFIGQVTAADSLEGLKRVPLSENLREALIRREKRSGAVGLRTGFHSALLSSANGYAFVLHLRGDLDPGLQPAAPGPFANNTLHCWSFGQDFDFQEHTMSGFFSAGREEFFETFSWRPLSSGGQWLALATDYSHVKNETHPTEAKSYLWHIPGIDFHEMPMPATKDYCLLAPREVVQVGEKAWVGIAVAGKRWRLVRIELN